MSNKKQFGSAEQRLTQRTRFHYPGAPAEATMLAMRTTGLIVIVTAVVALSACRCNKSPGPQTLPSAQPVVVAPAPSLSATPADAGVTTEGSDASVADAAILPAIVVMSLDFSPTKGSKYKPTKLKEDGSIAHPDKVIAKLTSDKLADDDGSPIAEFDLSGKVLFAGEVSEFKFNDNNELEGPAGFKISIGDDGLPKVVSKAGAAPEKLTGKFVDFDPKARRAAAIMLGLPELKKAAKKAAKAARAKASDGGTAEPKKEKKAKKDKQGKKNKKKKK